MKSSVAAVSGIVAFFGFGILCAGWSVAAVIRCEYLSAVTVFAMSAFSLGAAFIATVRWRPVTPRVTFDASGTAIKPDRSVQISVVVCEFFGIIGMGLFAIFYPLGKLDVPVPHPLRYYLPFMGAIGAVIATLGVVQNIFNSEKGYVYLSPAGFEFPRRSPSDCGKWDDVQDVVDQVSNESASSRDALVMIMEDGRKPTLTGGSFTPGGWAIRELVRFYWKNPECRVELTNGRALDRLRKEAFESP